MDKLDTWVSDSNALLLTDLYELTMVQAYFEQGMVAPAVFDLFVRRLPQQRNYLVACGLDDALRQLERWSVPDAAVAELRRTGLFTPRFLDRLRDLRFTGDVFAVPEGTVVFGDEPILEVVAPLPEAQLAETFLMNQIHLQTLAASKAARVVAAAAGRTIVDFGLRRVHGTDAAMKAARAFYVAGVNGTSNVLAGLAYGIPLAGTMAHSYIQAHRSEREAFRSFVDLYETTVLLVDTYDTLRGVSQVVELARELGDRFHVSALRIDSGDLGALSKAARTILDDAGLSRIRLFASSSLDEYEIAKLVAEGAPIDGFGVGARMGVSEDAPYMDMAYKLVEYAGAGRTKLSPGKPILPGRKQIFRTVENGESKGDVIGRHDERLAGRPLLVQVMENGRRTPAGNEPLSAARARAKREIDALPPRVRGLDGADPPYPVAVSDSLRIEHDRVRAAVTTGT
jgi:nicotinate phosphoribosyltransferase